MSQAPRRYAPRPASDSRPRFAKALECTSRYQQPTIVPPPPRCREYLNDAFVVATIIRARRGLILESGTLLRSFAGLVPEVGKSLKRGATNRGSMKIESEKTLQGTRLAAAEQLALNRVSAEIAHPEKQWPARRGIDTRVRRLSARLRISRIRPSRRIRCAE